MRRLVLAALVLFAVLLGCLSLRPASAHAAGSVCGTTVAGEQVAAPNFSIVDLDMVHTCGGSSGRLGVPVTQDASHPYTLSFDLSNMGSSTAPSFQAWVALRHVSRYTKYSVHFFASHAEIRRRVNDQMVILASAPYTVPVGSFAHVVIHEVGYTISVSVNGSLLLSATDATQGIPSGPSIVFYADGVTNICWDNVVGQAG